MENHEVLFFCPNFLTVVQCARLEDGLVLVAGDVLGDPLALALTVAHLAEHPPVGGEDALDGLHRAVGIGGDVQGGDGGGVGVLGGNLAVLDHLGEDGLRGHEAALAVGHGDGVHVVQLAQEHPGGRTGSGAGR